MAKRKVLSLDSTVVPGVGTFGTIKDVDGTEICKSVERDWQDNQPSISCVPAGLYKLSRVKSPKHGVTYCLVNERLGVTYAGPSTRTHILIHVANFPHELEGCIAPGTSYHSKKWGVGFSGDAFKSLKTILDEYIVETKGNLYLRIKRAEQ